MASAIPLRDAEYDVYLYNWKTLLTASPTTYGMTGSDATAISNAYTDWHTAFLAASNLLTRTRATVAQKDAEKVLSLSLLREQYRIIKANPGVTDAAKINLGIVVNDPVPTPIPAPTTYPLLAVLNAAPLTQQLMMVDQSTPTSRAKPAGVVGALVVRAIGTVPAVDPAQCQLLGLYTRAPFLVNEFGSGDVGKVVTYFARWTNPRGEEGPWSPAVSQILIG